MSTHILDQLAQTIHERRSTDADQSYTRRLLDAGPEKCAQKLGEEVAETIIAALVQTDEDLKNEAADLLYHLLVLLESRMVPLDEVLKVLQKRQGVSGLQEKASRLKETG